jgi:hypothetical protein
VVLPAQPAHLTGFRVIIVVRFDFHIENILLGALFTGLLVELTTPKPHIYYGPRPRLRI